MVNIIYVRGERQEVVNKEFEKLLNKAYSLFKENYTKIHGGNKKFRTRVFYRFITGAFYKRNMNIIDRDFAFSVSEKQVANIIRNKKGLYPIHSFELVVLLQKYINDFSMNPISFIPTIDTFFTLRNAQIEILKNTDSAIYDTPLIKYYHETKFRHKKNELLI